MPSTVSDTESYRRELRLFLEEICCNLCRFRHAEEDHVAPQDVRITQESHLDGDAFADIRVQVKQSRPYFLEVKYGYSPNEILTSLTRKYGLGRRPVDASKVILVVDPQTFSSWAELGSQIQGQMQDGLQLEVWDESALVSMLRKCFQIEIDSISEKSVLKICGAVDHAKGKYAFEDTWADDELQRTLMWHYGFWRLKQLRDGGRLDSRTIMPPGE